MVLDLFPLISEEVSSHLRTYTKPGKGTGDEYSGFSLRISVFPYPRIPVKTGQEIRAKKV